jgi:hypothetical protein
LELAEAGCCEIIERVSRQAIIIEVILFVIPMDLQDA